MSLQKAGALTTIGFFHAAREPRINPELPYWEKKSFL